MNEYRNSMNRLSILSHAATYVIGVYGRDSAPASLLVRALNQGMSYPLPSYARILSIPEQGIEYPEWMNDKQIDSLDKLYQRDSQGVTRDQFFQKVENFGDYVGVIWAGMFVGIEKDGYSHT